MTSYLRYLPARNEVAYFRKLLDVSLEIVPSAKKGIILINKAGKLKPVVSKELEFDEIKDVIELNKSDSFRESRMFSKDDLGQFLTINIGFTENERGKIILYSPKGTFSNRDIEVMSIFSNLAASYIALREYLISQGKFQKDLLLSMIKILEYYDKHTKGHSVRVAELSANIAEKMGLSDQDIKDAYWAGLVHDIGKIAIPINILNKEGRLTQEEYEIVKKHPIYGFDFLTTSSNLRKIAEYVYHHHERWDGKGYPAGLEKKMIPLISRIIAVADSWDAMTSPRSYRNPLPYNIALQELVYNMGKQFDPAVVKAFLNVLEEEKELFITNQELTS
ncbi:HD-GYP domain-containing protein [Thermosipho ferrireducens]|uniref:HD-GYP domain-containing protein n=2 Tax=Thermosipho ferrireducens TaxID=2571116 RepID=A0ABX7SAA3_9BACT|nr:HD-GYP domain-containing protein [Thermosipho ferrireducens]